MKVAHRIFLAGSCLATVLNPALAAQPSWSQAAIAKVAEHRTTPRSAQLRRATGVVQMEVDVDGHGMIISYRMVKSSGVPILDHEADMILFKVGSFNAPPSGTAQRLIIPIRW